MQKVRQTNRHTYIHTYIHTYTHIRLTNRHTNYEDNITNDEHISNIYTQLTSDYRTFGLSDFRTIDTELSLHSPIYRST